MTATAPKARFHAATFLRGGPRRAHHAASAIDAFIAAASEAVRQAETIECLASALRLSRAISDSARASSTCDALLDFVTAQLSESSGLGFAIQALELVAEERMDVPRVNQLAQNVTAVTSQLGIADRAFRVRLKLAEETDKAAIWCDRVERHRLDALAADEPAIRSNKLLDALQLAQQSGLRDLRDRISAELQECAKQDLGLVRFNATSR